MSQLSVQQALSILQLQPGATAQQIRAAFKRLALELHPDKLRPKQQQLQRHQQQHDKGSSSKVSTTAAVDPAAAFSLLSAAYDLLTTTEQIPAALSENCSSNGWSSFESAYASGELFSEALLDQAVVSGLPPADIADLHQICAAAVAGKLAEHLQQPPTAEQEHLWRQLYQQLTVKWQLEQLQQPHEQQGRVNVTEPGVDLFDLLSDLLIKPSGSIMVDVSDEEEEQHEQRHERRRQDQQRVTGNAISCYTATEHKQQFAAATESLHAAVACSASGFQHGVQETSTRAEATEQQRRQQPDQMPAWQDVDNAGRKKVQRHGLGFYWMWFRRLLVAKAVVCIMTSKPRRAREAHVFAVL